MVWLICTLVLIKPNYIVNGEVNLHTGFNKTKFYK